MAVFVTDPVLEERLKAERERSGADRYDETWEGTYMMAPMPDDEHQQIVMGIAAILQEAVGWPGLGNVRPGVNLAEIETEWQFDYRVPDVAVFLHGGRAENRGTHWRGGADFLVEVTSLDDRTREKMPFYSRLGVRELLVVDRQAWTLELYRWREGELKKAGQSSLHVADVLQSAVVPLRFRVVSGPGRPQIEVTHVPGGRQWLV
jgi:Uma2 family endonuclease